MPMQEEGVDFGPALRAMMREYGIPEEMLERKYMSKSVEAAW